MLPGPRIAKRLGLHIAMKKSFGSMRGANLVKVMTTLTVGTTGIATCTNGNNENIAECTSIITCNKLIPKNCSTE